MAYCSNCGAYIPDGETKCLACGYDETAEKSAAASAAAKAAYTESHRPASNSYDSELLRRQLEEQRRKQQENSRKWAEAERARRMQQEEEQRRERTYRNAGAAANRSAPAGNGKVNNSAGTGFKYAAICYLWGLWLIPLIFNRNDRFVMYHVKQGIALSIAATLATIVTSVFGMGWIVTVARIYMMVKGIKNANAGLYEPLPYIGEYAEKF